MRGASAPRGDRSVLAVIAALALGAVALAAPAAAMDFWDDRVNIHGFYEMDMRSIWRDFAGGEDWDFSSFAHTLNVEIEADLAPDGFGPFDLISAFGRVEVRFDCVWRRNCYLMQNANVYGDHPERYPKRLSDGRRSGFTGPIFTGDTRRYDAVADVFGLGFANKDRPADSRLPRQFSQIAGFSGFFSIEGPDGELGTADDPWAYTFESLLSDDCLYSHRKRKGGANGSGTDVLQTTPGCDVIETATLRDRAHPLKATDNHPIFGPGGGALPLRPVPEYRNSAQLGRDAPAGEAQGIFLPNERLARMLRDSDFDNSDTDFTVNELQWNRGASQQDEKELKELYVDLEMLDSRLWVRLGRQNIVWGKTEFFRTTDQFNPLDLVLSSSFQGLEQSRIALWAARAVYSFYEVGPLEDVRVELAFSYDQFEPTDLGRCGEPYTPLAVCAKSFGLIAHGVAGTGLAGEVKPPNPWNSWKGIEVGGRLEFRYDRFSFALTDFYGYSDSFYVDRLFSYSRNVDPTTGRPRKAMSEGRCRTGREDDCLRPDNALREHSVNQQLFAMICSSSVGFSSLDRSSCGQSVFNSQALADPTNPLSPTVVLAISNIVAGQNARGFFGPFGPSAAVLFELQLSGTGYTPSINAGLSRFCVACPTFVSQAPAGTFKPTWLVPLNRDPNDIDPEIAALGVTTRAAIDPDDGLPYSGAEIGANKNGKALWSVDTALSSFLSPQQEALLGCGPFYHTDCDEDGFDLMNTEFTAIAQSWPIIEGVFFDWDVTDRRIAQPGTTRFDGGPVCTRYERGRSFILPGCRGPGDAGYDPRVDGTTTGLLHPWTGQQFANEMAALSWNALQFLVANSTNDENPNQKDAFNPDNAFRTDGCSYRKPQLCSAVKALLDISATTRPSVLAGGNALYGRRDFIWSSGGDAVLRYEKRNVLGLSADFAEDVTKSNWSFEFTWVDDIPRANANTDFKGWNDVDEYNLTISVDRPTFINFLNANRTFFFNLQFAVQYIDGYDLGSTYSGPWNFFGVFFISTGYFQDRLLPGLTFIYDKRSNGGAVLSSVTYRFTENFSTTFGVNLFAGREEEVPIENNPLGPSSVRVGDTRGSAFVENFTAPVRDRDEVFVRLRYTF